MTETMIHDVCATIAFCCLVLVIGYIIIKDKLWQKKRKR